MRGDRGVPATLGAPHMARHPLALVEALDRGHGQPHVEGNRLELEADAFIFDASFPNAPYWKKLMRVGSPVGRLFHAPAAAKLSTGEIWDALKENRLKLPNTISIDSLGRVFLTPHQLSYTLSQRLQRADFGSHPVADVRDA